MYNALIIDDEKHVRQAISFLGMWNENGINPPFEATDGQSALDFMEQTPVDIVLVDIKMPVMNGMQFLEAATHRFPKAKYIIISGFNDFEYAKKAIRFQIMDYLLKPVSETELNHCLENAVKQLNDELELTRANPLGDLINLFCSRDSGGSHCAIASIRTGKPVPEDFSWDSENIRLLSSLLADHGAAGEEYMLRMDQPWLLIAGIFTAGGHHSASLSPAFPVRRRPHGTGHGSLLPAHRGGDAHRNRQFRTGLRGRAEGVLQNGRAHHLPYELICGCSYCICGF